MEEYLRISLILSVFGFLKEIRPSEPFFTDFINDVKSKSLEEVQREIFLIGTYVYIPQLIAIFLITDLLRHKPLIILLGGCGVAIWSIWSLLFVNMSLWTSINKSTLEIVAILYGTYHATEVAYFSYIYAKTDKQHYQAVTSHTRAAILAGKFVAALTALLLVFYKITDYRQLNCLTLISQIMAFIWAFFIPRVKRSLDFNRDTSGNQFTVLHQIWINFKISYSNKMVLLWSFYYAISLCFYLQISADIQDLWIRIDDSQETIYNNVVKAIGTLLGAGVSILAGKMHINFLKSNVHTLLVLIAMSSVQGAFAILTAKSQTLLMCYVFYICYDVTYAFGITICATEIAKNLADNTFGLVFGFNTLINFIVRMIVSLSVVCLGFKLSPSGWYTVYGFGYIVLSGVYLITLSYDIIKAQIRNS